MRHTRILATCALAALIGFGPASLFAAPIVFETLNADLTSGSLAGVTFPVTFSYDASQVDPAGTSFIGLSSFDFDLLGTDFTRNDIDQGGQVVLVDGILSNVTASFQDFIKPGAPVSNITFGFGGPGIIGYVDTTGNFGSGVFSFAAAAPEPGAPTLLMIGLGFILISGLIRPGLLSREI